MLSRRRCFLITVHNTVAYTLALYPGADCFQRLCLSVSFHLARMTLMDGLYHSQASIIIIPPRCHWVTLQHEGNWRLGCVNVTLFLYHILNHTLFWQEKPVKTFLVKFDTCMLLIWLCSKTGRLLKPLEKCMKLSSTYSCLQERLCLLTNIPHIVPQPSFCNLKEKKGQSCPVPFCCHLSGLV